MSCGILTEHQPPNFCERCGTQLFVVNTVQRRCELGHQVWRYVGDEGHWLEEFERQYLFTSDDWVG